MKLLRYVLLMLLLMNSACNFQRPEQIDGSGDIIKKSFDVQGFNKIELDTVGDMYIKQGAADSLMIEADDNILPLLEVHMDGDTLILRAKGIGHRLKPSSKLIYTITVKTLTKVATNASGNIHAAALEANDLFVMATGSGDVMLASVVAPQLWLESDGSGSVFIDQVKSQNVQANTRGSGDIKLAGKTNILQINSDGSGNVMADDLHAATCEISIHGSGDALLWVDDTLNVSINGSGNGKYYGEPAVTQSITGSGKVQSLGRK